MSQEDVSDNNPKEDLDALLHGVESKLRGPYSSLDFTKMVTTPSLRGSLSPREYLGLVSQVLSRPDKVVQMRILVGLLGLDPSEEIDEEIYNILTKAQEAPLHEEWVRVIAGLVSGIMFVDDQKKKTVTVVHGEEELAVDDEFLSTTRTCRGEEADDLVNKTCRDILDHVLKFEKETEPSPSSSSFSSSSSILTTDMYPLFIPFRYSLLNPDLLQRVVPECMTNPHFQVNETAEILSMDSKLEKIKAQEEKDHETSQTANGQSNGNNSSTDTKSPAKPVFMPGMRSGTAGTTNNNNPSLQNSKTKQQGKKPVAKKSSMFMPSRKPGVGVTNRMGRQPMKSALHSRKAGAAKMLLGNNRNLPGVRGTGTNTGSSTMGRAAKLTNQPSRMRMIDVEEVQGLTEEHKKRDKVQTREDRKRKLLETAAQRGLLSNKTKSKGLAAMPSQRVLQQQKPARSLSSDTAATATDTANSSNSMMTAIDVQDDNEDFPHTYPGGMGDIHAGMSTTPGGATATASKQQEWRQLLDQRSNKLSSEDRYRVEQFFQERYNPTPDVQVYKMKLHEERTTDPNTGKEMKETFYLELDYTTFTSKQSKKTKRYG